MALYFYQALTKEGKKITGYIDAGSQQEVKERLVAQGRFPITIYVAPEQARQSFFSRIFSRGVTVKDKILFTKQLAVLLKSGIPLLQAIELLVDQFTGQLRSILISVKDGIKEGGSFADGLKKYPKVFDTIYVQLVRAGEASGKLEVILERLTGLIERQDEISRRVRSALTTPMIQLGVAALVVIGLMVFVVPQMTANFAQLGKELPGPTKVLIAISNVITNYYLFLIVGIIGLIVVYKYWSSSPAGARLIDRIKLKLPIVKFFARTGAIVQFSQTLGMLLESGVNLSEALDIVVEITDNRILKDALNEARDKIIKQGKIAQYLKQTELFPPIAIYLIKTGEESGQLDSMLLSVANNYEADIRESADGLSAKLGPLLMIVMAIVVGFIVVAIAMPMMEMMGAGGDNF